MNRLRYICVAVVAVALLGGISSCGDDNADRFLVDIDAIESSLPGSWTVTDITTKQVEGEYPEVDWRVYNSQVSFDGSSFNVVSPTDGLLYKGTYNIRKFYIAVQREGGKKDTLQLKRFDRIMDNEVLKAIRERRSIRRFKPEQITDEELTAVLEAGTWAATGHGTQAPFIVAVQNPAQRDLLASLNAEIFGIDSDPYYGAPTLVLVFAPKDNDNNYRDGSLVLGNMMLAAHSIGLASCWINRVDRMSEREQCQQLMREWGLPEGLIGIGSLALGYASSHPRTVKPRKDGYYRVIR